jgi:hypothetical protein
MCTPSAPLDGSSGGRRAFPRLIHNLAEVETVEDLAELERAGHSAPTSPGCTTSTGCARRVDDVELLAENRTRVVDVRLEESRIETRLVTQSLRANDRFDGEDDARHADAALRPSERIGPDVAWEVAASSSRSPLRSRATPRDRGSPRLAVGAQLPSRPQCARKPFRPTGRGCPLLRLRRHLESSTAPPSCLHDLARLVRTRRHRYLTPHRSRLS